MARLLKLVGWSQQASSLRPWVLKTPQHMLDLPVLMELFPDARLIFTHRDPLAVVGSAASLAWNQTVIYSDHADPGRVGAEWLRKTRLQIDRMHAARRDIPRERQIDIHYEEMERDWRGAMARVYRMLGLELAPALPAMEAYQQRAAGDGVHDDDHQSRARLRGHAGTLGDRLRPRSARADRNRRLGARRRRRGHGHDLEGRRSPLTIG
jgi:hypothetical protein